MIRKTAGVTPELQGNKFGGWNNNWATCKTEELESTKKDCMAVAKRIFLLMEMYGMETKEHRGKLAECQTEQRFLFE